MYGWQQLRRDIRKVRIKPYITEHLDWAKVGYDSIRGPINVAWTRDGQSVTLNVEIPDGVLAQVHVPGRGSAVAVKPGKHSFKGSL